MAMGFPKLIKIDVNRVKENAKKITHDNLNMDCPNLLNPPPLNLPNNIPNKIASNIILPPHL